MRQDTRLRWILWSRFWDTSTRGGWLQVCVTALLGRVNLTIRIGKYLEALENIKADYPLTMLPLHGSYVSATGPSCWNGMEHLDKFDGKIQHLIIVEEPAKHDKNILSCNSLHSLLASPLCRLRDRPEDCGGGGVDGLGWKTFNPFYKSRSLIISQKA